MRLLLLFLAIPLLAAPPIKIQSFKCTPKLAPGATGTCVLVITKAAPKGGAVFKITLKGSGLTIPMTVTIPKGATSIAFPIVYPKPTPVIA